MSSRSATGRALSRAAPLTTTAALAASLLMIVMLAGTAFAQSPDASASVDPAASAPATVAISTTAASPDAASPNPSTLPDTATGDPRSDGPTSNVSWVVGIIGIVAALVLAIGLFGAHARRTAVVRDDDSQP